MTTMPVASPGLLPTPQTVSQQLISGITTDQAQQATLEEEISSGITINQPSNNPALTAQYLTLNAGLTRAGQYVSNATDGEGWLQEGTSTLNQAMSVLQNVEQAVISVSGQSLAGQKGAITGISAQVSAGLQELTDLSNTTYDGQYIFSGTSSQPPYDAAGNYVGTADVPSRTVAPSTTVNVAIPGSAAFGTGSTGLLGTSGILSQIVTALHGSNPTTAVAPLLGNLQAAMSTTAAAAATLGANYQNMQTFTAQATATQQALQTEIGTMVDVNLPQATTQLTAAQESYQAALWAVSQISQDSLANFLS